MAWELERRYALANHPGAVRLLTFLTHAHMGSYEATVTDPTLDADITRTREYRFKFVNHPAYNRDRGPVSVFGARLHWEF